MVSISNWSADQPSGSSSIRVSSPQIRSHWSILEAALKQEHNFSAASTGIHLPGAGRIFFGARSSLVTPASADSAGRLFLATDTGALIYLNASSSSTIVQGVTATGLTPSVIQQNVGSASWTTLLNSNATITAGAEGIYALRAQAQFITGGSNSSCGAVGIAKNGARICIGSGPLATGFSISVSIVTSATSGDIFSMQAYHNYGSTISCAGAATDGFLVYRIR